VESHGSEIARLEKIMAGDPGAPAFPALAEALRRAGRAAEAERVARAGLRERPDQVAGRVALGLALLDLARVEDARAELARALEAIPDHVLARTAFGGPAVESGAGEGDAGDESALAQIGESEVEAALAAARAERDTMLDAERVALAALHDVEGRESELSDAREGAGALVAGAGSPFATRTVAELLERQGDFERAASVRRSLGERAARDSDAKRQALVAELERWLARLRRGDAR
jgi:tetratricopeptide (TPR) repeat protein